MGNRRNIDLLGQEITAQAGALRALGQASRVDLSGVTARWSKIAVAQRRLVALVDDGAVRRAISSGARKGLGARSLVQLADPVEIAGAGIGWVGRGNDDSGSGWDERVGSGDGKGIGAVLHYGGNIVRSSAVGRSAIDDVEVAKSAAAACREATVAAGLSSRH